MSDAYVWSLRPACPILIASTRKRLERPHCVTCPFFPTIGRRPCGKQHFREIATPDWVGTLRRFTNTQQYVLFVKLSTQSGVAISRKCCFPHEAALRQCSEHKLRDFRTPLLNDDQEHT